MTKSNILDYLKNYGNLTGEEFEFNNVDGLGRWVILIVCAIVFCGSLGYLGLYVKDKMGAQKDFATLETAKDSGLEKLYAKNNDFVGWLKINGTKVNYPVMHTPSYFRYRRVKSDRA